MVTDFDYVKHTKNVLNISKFPCVRAEIPI